MHYRPQKPFAVFLGPSLARSHAANIFAANYYPPARMGDIYQLLGTGVRIILLIDGVFHTTASVWQREILDALDNDIAVIGASSMGALRAAELYPFGMVGRGTIFEWYRDGVIVGDDEVALFHAGEEHNFQPFSEPLVNIRYTLQHAVAKKCIDPALATVLIEHAQHTYYAARSYDRLLNSDVVMSWQKREQEALTQFIQYQSVNLKQQDAIDALQYCASMVEQVTDKRANPFPTKNRAQHYQLLNYRRRGFLQTEGDLVSGGLVLAEALKDIALVKMLRPVLTKNFFLLLWTKQNKIDCPTDYAESYQQRWRDGHSNAGKEHFLQANGLTEREFQAAVAERALLAWLVEQGPASFGLTVKPYVQLMNALRLDLNQVTVNETTELDRNRTKAGNTLRRIKWSTQASELCFLAAWARENGVICPLDHRENLISHWEAACRISTRAAWLKQINMPEDVYLGVLAEWACVDWLIEKEPSYFGYTSWSLEVALLRELQVTGQAAWIVSKMASQQ